MFPVCILSVNLLQTFPQDRAKQRKVEIIILRPSLRNAPNKANSGAELHCRCAFWVKSPTWKLYIQTLLLTYDTKCKNMFSSHMTACACIITNIFINKGSRKKIVLIEMTAVRHYNFPPWLYLIICCAEMQNHANICLLPRCFGNRLKKGRICWEIRWWVWDVYVVFRSTALSKQFNASQVIGLFYRPPNIQREGTGGQMLQR